jgi:hypothetical protein
MLHLLFQVAASIRKAGVNTKRQNDQFIDDSLVKAR